MWRGKGRLDLVLVLYGHAIPDPVAAPIALVGERPNEKRSLGPFVALFMIGPRRHRSAPPTKPRFIGVLVAVEVPKLAVAANGVGFAGL